MKRYDICTGRKDKDGKTRWQKIGVMFPAQGGDGFSIKLEAYPLPNEKGDVWISAFVPKEREAFAPSRREPKIDHLGGGDLNDDLPPF